MMSKLFMIFPLKAWWLYKLFLIVPLKVMIFEKLMFTIMGAIRRPVQYIRCVRCIHASPLGGPGGETPNLFLIFRGGGGWGGGAKLSTKCSGSTVSVGLRWTNFSPVRADSVPDFYFEETIDISWGRLPLHGFYLWRHVFSTAPPFILWSTKMYIMVVKIWNTVLFDPLPAVLSS
jgi:hypothetical protein